MTQLQQQLFKALEQMLALYPDMRVGQLIVNLSNWATRKLDAAYDVEDEQLLAAAVRHLEQRDVSLLPAGRPGGGTD